METEQGGRIMLLDSYIQRYTKIDSKWTKDLIKILYLEINLRKYKENTLWHYWRWNKGDMAQDIIIIYLINKHTFRETKPLEKMWNELKMAVGTTCFLSHNFQTNGEICDREISNSEPTSLCPSEFVLSWVIATWAYKCTRL